MAAARQMPLSLETTEKFVKECGTTFGWGDLSEDTVMDLGCGRKLYCTRTVLAIFPNVKSIIAFDANPEEIREIAFKSPRIIKFIADILKSPDIRPYEGKVDKIISTHVLHQIPNKEKVFENVYRLLKPGGEAAFLFTTDLGLYHVLDILRQNSRFKDYFKGSDIFEFYSRNLKANNYREMLENIGFKVIEIREDKYYFSMFQFGVFELGTLQDSVLKAFSVPEDLMTGILDSACRLYRNKYCDQNSMYALTKTSVFVTKPCESDTACPNY